MVDQIVLEFYLGSGREAMAHKLEMTLDDVIRTDDRPRRKGSGKTTGGCGSRAEKGGGGNRGSVRVGKRVYVGNLSYSTSWQDLKDHFRKVGNVVYSNVMENEDGRKKGCGIVEFEKPEEAASAIENLHDTMLDGRLVIVREDREDRDLKGGGKGAITVNITSSGVPNGGSNRGNSIRKRRFSKLGDGRETVQVAKRLYVSNLSWNTSWQDLKDHFSTIGHVVYTNVMKEVDGRSKGCGIVEFEKSREAVAAINKLHDSILGGRQIIVREDREDRDLKDKRPQYLPTMDDDDDAMDDDDDGKRCSALQHLALCDETSDGDVAPKRRRVASAAARPSASATPSKASGTARAVAFNGQVTVGKRIYVGNLAWNTSWQDLKDFFRDAGNVVYSNVMQDAGGHSKGCGIVEFERPGQAAVAIETLNGSLLKNRKITVREDREDRDLQ